MIEREERRAQLPVLEGGATTIHVEKGRRR